MELRLFNTTIWFWCLLALFGGSWSPVRCVTVKSPPKNPSTIEAQAKFFQDFFSVQLSPYKIEFGHVCEDPNTWEQRYEKKDYKNHRDMGKVRWGDKKGGYGEHYWDLNHAGHSGNHGNDDYSHDNGNSDDGSYHDNDNGNNYDGSNDNASVYSADDYDPEKASYEESGRAKRTPPKGQSQRKFKHSHDENEPRQRRPYKKHKEQLQEAPSHNVENYSAEDDTDDEDYTKSKHQYRQEHEDDDDDKASKKKARNKVVLVVQEKEDKEPESKNTYTNKQDYTGFVPYEGGAESKNAYTNKQDYTGFVPYEGGAGVRQHHQPEVAATASVPRLFLEPSTGHVIDRATGQAYVLQPIAIPNYN